MNLSRKHTLPCKIGMLRWEEQGCPMGLMQLELLVGNSTNPDSYDFPICFERVPGANIHTVVESPNQDVLRRMIELGNKMVQEKQVRAITTSCGFNAIFQAELASAIPVPVYTSSLLQIPLVELMIGQNRHIAVITASKACLTSSHFSAVGVTDLSNIHVIGLEEVSQEWNKIFLAPEEKINIDQVRREMVEQIQKLQAEFPMGAVILECTDLPPFAEEIKQATGLPVYDIITLTNYVYQTLQ